MKTETVELERKQLDGLLAAAEIYVIAIIREALAQPPDDVWRSRPTIEARTELLDVIERLPS